MSRLSRFVTLFVLASYFTNVEYGTAMLAVVCHDLFRVLTRLGVGAKIIQCSRIELNDVCSNAITLQWMTTALVAFIQFMMAGYIAEYYQNEDLKKLIEIMAVSHIIYPVVTVKIFIMQRENRLRYFGVASGLCIAFENLLVALLVFITSDVMMVAYVKIAASIFWVILFLPAKTKNYIPAFDPIIILVLLKYSIKMLGSEILKAFRWQADSLFAARILSPELFGLYSFAKSASIGIGQTLISAFISGIFPFLCSQIRVNKFKLGVQQSAIAVGGLCLLFVIQSFFAPWYITLLFEDRWEDALITASLLCLVAAPILICDYLSTLFRVQAKVGVDLCYMAVCSFILVMGFMWVQPTDLTGIVYVMLISGGFCVLGGAIITYGCNHSSWNSTNVQIQKGN